MSVSYRHTVKIDSRDVDGHGHCKISALLGHLQEAATRAAENGGFGRNIMIERYNSFWMLTRSWLRLERPLHWDEELTIHTWHRGGKAVTSYRDYDLYVDGVKVGEGTAIWVFANMEDRKLLRLKNLEEMQGTDGGELCKTKILTKLRRPEELVDVEQRPMRYSDTDINGHVNNTRYADFACDTTRFDQMEKGTFLSEIQIGYLAECRPGEVLTMQMGELDDHTYVCGLDKSGKASFEAALFFGKVRP